MNLQFIDAGRLNSALQLYQSQPAYDDSGSYRDQWNEIAALWGQVLPVRAEQSVFAGQKLSHVTHHITIRYRNDVASGMQLRKKSRIFTIHTAHDPDESRRYLICLVQEETL